MQMILQRTAAPAVRCKGGKERCIHMNKKILLWFDVEDYLTPESDDAFMALLDMLDESGARATIKFCTKKLEQLRERGRTDIIAKLAGHEMSFHTTSHSVHPLPSEYLDNYGFACGASEFERRERAGFELLQDLCGQNLTSYGQPGPAWAPHVFPALRKWGVYTYLDAHEIVGAGGQPFWYGGLLCFTKLNNLSHLVKDGSSGNMIRQFDAMDTRCADTVFFSIYDHPTEFSSSEFWDEVNFAGGRNPYTFKPAPLRTAAERDGLIGQYRDFIAYTAAQPDVEYVTALEAMRLEHQRTRPITKADVESYAASMENIGICGSGAISYAEVGGAYLSASELFNLAARYLTGRMLIPELLYGPERFEKSVVTQPRVSARRLAETAFQAAGRVCGYKQLCPVYRVGDNFLNPVDMMCTMLRAIRTGETEVDIDTQGRLAAADNVDTGFEWGKWPLWAPGFKAEGIFEHTKLQCWTLKPAIF